MYMCIFPQSTCVNRCVNEQVFAWCKHTNMHIHQKLLLFWHYKCSDVISPNKRTQPRLECVASLKLHKGMQAYDHLHVVQDNTFMHVYFDFRWKQNWKSSTCLVVCGFTGWSRPNFIWHLVGMSVPNGLYFIQGEAPVVNKNIISKDFKCSRLYYPRRI